VRAEVCNSTRTFDYLCCLHLQQMPVLVNGRMCLPIGARVYQHDAKDSRVAAAAKVLPLLLAFAGLISCGSAIVNENISI
jgi:hypothetical protein